MNGNTSNRRPKPKPQDFERLEDPHALARKFIESVKHGLDDADEPGKFVEYYGGGHWGIAEDYGDDVDFVKVPQEIIEIKLCQFVREVFEDDCLSKFNSRKADPFDGRTSSDGKTRQKLPKIPTVSVLLIRNVILALKSYCYVNPRDSNK
ncbi:MAG: hypothetical protein MUC43_05100 [Pirellula sp.]|jgi:hypothetical protein|nr:hypothetical protein [Pirellula sp.]